MHQAQREFKMFTRDQQPLANERPERTRKLGSFMQIDTQHNRSHIQVKKGAPLPSLRRLVRVLLAQKHQQGASLLIGHTKGKSVSYGTLSKLTFTKLLTILKRIRGEGGFLVVNAPEAGGAIDSNFWTHHGIAGILAR